MDDRTKGSGAKGQERRTRVEGKRPSPLTALPGGEQNRAADGRSSAGVLASLLVIGLLAAGVAAVVVYVPKLKPPVPPTEPPVVNVKVLAVRAEPVLHDTFDLPGVVHPNRVVKVSAEVAAKVEAYAEGGKQGPAQPGRPENSHVLAEGDKVSAGEPVVFLNADLLKADHEHARAQALLDQRDLARLRDLHARKLATDQELDQALTKAAISQAALDAAGARLERAVIRGPIDGILNRLPVEVGEYVQPGTVVAEIVDCSLVKIVVDVPERDVGFLKAGMMEEILVNESSGDRLWGEITYISELADPQTLTTRVEITIDNAEQVLRSGQIVRVRLTRRVLHEVIMIPLEAVIPTEQGRFVYVVEGGQAVQRRVELGFMKGSRVRVEPFRAAPPAGEPASTAGNGAPTGPTGLHPGELLIVSGHRFVGEGQPVRIIEKQAVGP